MGVRFKKALLDDKGRYLTSHGGHRDGRCDDKTSKVIVHEWKDDDTIWQVDFEPIPSHGATIKKYGGKFEKGGYLIVAPRPLKSSRLDCYVRSEMRMPQINGLDL